MKPNRRKFISTALAGGAASLASPSAGAASPAVNARYGKLDEILKQPVLKKQFFKAPVIIETLELLRLNDSFLCRCVPAMEPKASPSATAE